MSRYIEITTGDPEDPTNTFTSNWFLDSWTVDERGEWAEANWGVYRTVAADEPSGEHTSTKFRITAFDTTLTDTSGNTIQVLFSDWQTAGGLVTADEIFDNVKTLTVFWTGNNESVDLSTGTEKP